MLSFLSVVFRIVGFDVILIGLTELLLFDAPALL
jgi:hypothetical protein